MPKTLKPADGEHPTEDELQKIAEDLENDKDKDKEEVDDENDDDEKEKDDAGDETGGEDDDSEESDGDEEENGDDEKDDEASGDEKEDDEQTDKKEVVEEKDKKPVKKLKDLTPEETRQKLIDSSREAQILYARNKQVQDAIVSANNIPAPTDDEMRKEFNNWDELDEFSKRMARDNITNSRRLSAVTAVTQDFKNQDDWMEKVDTFIDNPETITKTPELDGLEDEFKKFASLPTRRGGNFSDLVGAFLYERETVKKNTPKKKGKMFPTGSGGVKVDKKPSKLSASDAAVLRKTNYPKFVQMLKAGKIDSAEL